MKITSRSFGNGEPIPDANAFGKPDAKSHFALSENKNPHLAWDDPPAGTKSLVLVVDDPDVPTDPDTVNKEDRVVPRDQPRGHFTHWVMVDIPPDVREIPEGSCSNDVTPKGKRSPPGPPGSRQGVNDYTGWFAADAEMGGQYRGYDGPAPPWNDERVHRYHFRLIATDLERCPVEGSGFRASDVLAAIEGHVLAESELVGTYTMNPKLRR